MKRKGEVRDGMGWDGDVEECSVWEAARVVRREPGVRCLDWCREAFRQRSPASCNHPRPAPISDQMCLACPVLAAC